MHAIRILIASCLIALGCILATAMPADAAATPCGATYWPTSRRLVGTYNGATYSAQLSFKLSQAEATALRCRADWLEIDFPLYGFNMPNRWDQYTISSNIKNARPDISWPDQATMPAATLIWTGDLQPGTSYYVHLNFRLPLAKPIPTVGLRWVPSHWARGVVRSGKEAFSCGMPGGFSGNPAWCLFGNDGQDKGLGNPVSFTWPAHDGRPSALPVA